VAVALEGEFVEISSLVRPRNAFRAAMRVNDEDRSPRRIHGRDTTSYPSSFTELSAIIDVSRALTKKTLALEKQAASAILG
jgi:hypothetical protein